MPAAYELRWDMDDDDFRKVVALLPVQKMNGMIFSPKLQWFGKKGLVLTSAMANS